MKKRFIRLVMIATLAALMSPTSAVLGADAAGIAALIQVAQTKVNNANAEAVKAANDQKKLVEKEKTVNAQRLELQHHFEADAKRFAEISADLKRISEQVAKLNCK